MFAVHGRGAGSGILVVCALSACGDNLPGAPHASFDAARDDDVPPEGPFTWAGGVIGGGAADEVLDLELVRETLYVAGYRDGIVGVTNLEPSGDAEGFLLALAPDGSERWTRMFDTDGAETVDAIHVGATDLVLVGRTSGAFPGFTNNGQVDAFVVRAQLDAASTPTLVQFGDARPQHMVAIARETSGVVHVAGYDDAFVENQAVTAFENPIATHLSPSLAVVSYRRDDRSASSDWHYALVPAGSPGEIIVGGGLFAGAGRGPFVRRYAADGAEVWNLQLGVSGSDTVTALRMHADGKLYVAGSTFEQIGDRSYGDQDLFVAVVDPATGVVERAMQAGSSSSDYPRDLVIAPDGTIFVVGETLGSLPGATLAGDYDLAIVRFATDGTWTGSWQRGTGDDETINAATLAPDALYIAGRQLASNVPGHPSAGGRDGFVLRVPFGDLVEP
ncbi:MAG: hypothetical protein SFX73_26360 [Kofleriaceae bacterium]|nr:hypothetical protein [Kofleriaceae bacterium]